MGSKVFALSMRKKNDYGKTKHPAGGRKAVGRREIIMWYPPFRESRSSFHSQVSGTRPVMNLVIILPFAEVV
jgi:hypothetical protein